MAWTIALAVKQAALNGITALFSNGHARLLNASDEELARPAFAFTPFGVANGSNPPQAAAAAMTADTTITAGTVTKIQFRTSADVLLINGTVGTSGADFNVTNNVIPAEATSVNLTGMVFSLDIA